MKIRVETKYWFRVWIQRWRLRIFSRFAKRNGLLIKKLKKKQQKNKGIIETLQSKVYNEGISSVDNEIILGVETGDRKYPSNYS